MGTNVLTSMGKETDLVDVKNEREEDFANFTGECVAVNEEGWTLLMNEEEDWSVVVNEDDDWCQLDLGQYLEEPTEEASATPHAIASQDVTPHTLSSEAATLVQDLPDEEITFHEHFTEITTPLTPMKQKSTRESIEEFVLVEEDLCATETNNTDSHDKEVVNPSYWGLAIPKDSPFADDCWSDHLDVDSALGVPHGSKYFFLDDNALNGRRKIDLLGNRERRKAAKKNGWRMYRNRYLY